jgi:hypothetical protein
MRHLRRTPPPASLYNVPPLWTSSSRTPRVSSRCAFVSPKPVAIWGPVDPIGKRQLRLSHPAIPKTAAVSRHGRDHGGVTADVP